MGQIVFIPREVDGSETRVAASPDTVKRMAALGFEVVVEKGAGIASRIVDEDFAKAGAVVGKAADAARADVVLKVRRPTEAELKGYKKGAIVIAVMDPYGNEAAVAALARAGVTAFSMEFMPRITRAQSMDVLSSHRFRRWSSFQGKRVEDAWLSRQRSMQNHRCRLQAHRLRPRRLSEPRSPSARASSRLGSWRHLESHCSQSSSPGLRGLSGD